MNIRGDRRLEDEERTARYVMQFGVVAVCGKVLSIVCHVLNVVNSTLANRNVPYGRGLQSTLGMQGT